MMQKPRRPYIPPTCQEYVSWLEQQAEERDRLLEELIQRWHNFVDAMSMETAELPECDSVDDLLLRKIQPLL